MNNSPANPTDNSGSTLADALVRRMSSLSDPKTRIALLRALCPTLPAEALAEARAEIARRAGERETAAQITLVALYEALAKPPLRGERAAAGTGEGDLRDKGAVQNDWGKGRPLTLGERKSLARKPDRALIDKALRDVHPDVIAELLVNPRLTEADVARMCSSPHATPPVLARVFGEPRWATRPMVRLALAASPRAPVEISLALLPLLSREELRGIADDLRLNDTVRAQARSLTRPRRGQAPDEGPPREYPDDE